MNGKIVSVSELTNTIKFLLEEKVGYFSVQGEISNYKHHSSGHRYFTLKDEGAQVSCVMWRGKSISFQPTDGMKVVATGHLSVFAPRGQYQVDCDNIIPVGKGDLFLAFEALKKKLGELGYFDPERKRPLPYLPFNIGVSTSPTGAAIRDIITTLNRRFPAATVWFRPTLVQGDGSAEDIVRAINELNNTPSDVIIIGRGGGSMEDLWAYNMEMVAEAIFKSKLPIISAVGHETDFTIADFVADMRAATPTAAAELATPVTSADLQSDLVGIQDQFERSIQQRINNLKSMLDKATGDSAFRRIKERILLFEQQIDDIETQMIRSAKVNMTIKRQRLDALESQCRSLAPLAPLGRGFAYLLGNGKIIPNDRSMTEYKNIEVFRLNETALIKVLKILPKSLFS